LILVAVGVAALLFFRQRSGPETGTVAQDFSLPVIAGSGQTFQLSAERGKPVLIEVFASWCGVCRRAAPTLRDAAAAPRKRDVRFVGVSVDREVGDARGAAQDWAIPYDVAIDNGSFSRAYDIKVLPTFVLVDAEGRVRRVSTGAPRSGEVESWLEEVGAERL
jgi:thiol-disulfide isomerase/thioredoxin